jgi:predicted nucleotidyltransferase/DNA-binding XRE family transcriptional regulator
MNVAELLRRARTDADLTQAELARRAGTSQPAVARYEAGVSSPSVTTLDRLVHAAGQRLVIEVMPASGHADLSGGRMGQLKVQRRSILQKARRHGARHVRVFGSVARGEDGPDSDVDLLVDFDIGGPEGIRPLVRLRRELSELLGEDVDVVTPALLRSDLSESVLADAVAL